MQGDLCGLAAEIKQRHQKPRGDDAERVQTPQIGDDDGGKAVTGGNVEIELADRAGNFTDAGDARDHARKHQRKPGGAVGRKTGVTRSGGRVAANLDLEVQETARVESPESKDGKEGDENRSVNAQTFKQGREQRRIAEHDRLREVHAFRVAPRAVDHIGEQVVGDIGKHQRRQRFLRVKARFEQGGNRAPECAAQCAGQHHGRKNPGGIAAFAGNGDAAAGERADDQLAFGADVVDARLEAERQPLRNQD